MTVKELKKLLRRADDNQEIFLMVDEDLRDELKDLYQLDQVDADQEYKDVWLISYNKIKKV